jgi:hypothetical protein
MKFEYKNLGHGFLTEFRYEKQKETEGNNCGNYATDDKTESKNHSNRTYEYPFTNKERGGMAD